jgi:NitT/TauT family transport system substrate-binding protein
VSLRLDWTLTGYQLPFYWAKQKGYFTAETLNVDIKEGAGSGKTVSLMAGQQDDIGFADYMLMAAGVAKGMKLKAVYGVVQNGAWAVISLAENPITKPQDLIGKSVAVTADHKALLDLLLAANKISPDRLSIRVTSAATRNTVFVNGQVDSFVSIVIGSPLDLVVRARQGKGKPLHFMPFEDFGVAPLGQGVLVHEQTIAQKPDMVRRFLRATARALNEVTKKENFDEAVDIAMRLSGAPADRRDSVQLQWQEAIPRLRTKNTAGRPYGWMSEADWQEASDILLKTGTIDKPFPAESFYSNAFVPQS